MQFFSYTRMFFLLIVTWIIPIAHAAANDDNAFLQHITTIIDPNRAQKEIRFRIRGNKTACLALFKHAAQTENVVAQVYCANAYSSMYSDSEENFSKIKVDELTSHALKVTRLSSFVAHVCEKSEVSDWKKPSATERYALNVVRKAAELGNPFAQLVQICMQRAHNRLTLSFGHACRLHALMKDNGTFAIPELQYAFGDALASGDHNNNERLILEGLKHMVASGLTSIPYVSEYAYNWAAPFCVTHNALRHYESNFIADKWQQFKQSHLDPLPNSPIELFKLFEQHDMQEIYHIVDKHHISILPHEDGLGLEVYAEKPPYYIMVTECIGDIRLNGGSIYNGADYKQEMKRLESFLHDALTRCRHADAIRDIIVDMEKHPEAFCARKQTDK